MTDLTVRIAPRTIVLTLALLIGLWAVQAFAEIWALLALSLILASALLPAVHYLESRKFPRILATLVVFLGLFGLLGILGLIIAPVIVDQAASLIDSIPIYAQKIQTWVSQIRAMDSRLHLLPSTEQMGSFVSQRLSMWLRSTLSVTAQLLGVLIGLGGVLITTFFLVAQGPLLRRGFLALVPWQFRDRIAAQFDPISFKLGAYVRGLLINMTVLFVLLAIGLSIAGVPYAWILALLAALLDVIPLVGTTLGAVPAILVALTVSWKLALIVLAIYVAANIVQSNVVGPLVLSSAVEVPPVLVFFALMIGAQILGILGALLAVPMLAAVMVLVQNLYVPAVAGSGAESPKEPPKTPPEEPPPPPHPLSEKSD